MFSYLQCWMTEWRKHLLVSGLIEYNSKFSKNHFCPNCRLSTEMECTRLAFSFYVRIAFSSMNDDYLYQCLFSVVRMWCWLQLILCQLRTHQSFGWYATLRHLELCLRSIDPEYDIKMLRLLTTEIRLKFAIKLVSINVAAKRIPASDWLSNFDLQMQICRSV